MHDISIQFGARAHGDQNPFDGAVVSSLMPMLLVLESVAMPTLMKMKDGQIGRAEEHIVNLFMTWMYLLIQDSKYLPILDVWIRPSDFAPPKQKNITLKVNQASVKSNCALRKHKTLFDNQFTHAVDANGIDKQNMENYSQLSRQLIQDGTSMRAVARKLRWGAECTLMRKN
ncbi:unnamed protein product [Ranitomeya imitator]|uniref:Uncharacterized protein n=1 Tax=Ranitomeya imitator TaxID=111125 RepID=A0ABN9LH44_9NEOB|nr:unnamed protein product [Ranitomeya imitator]